MDKNRFETQKHVVNLDIKKHPIQNYFTVEDLKWLIEQAEKVEQYETALKEISLIHNYDGFKAKDIAKIVLMD